jgi:hypothetical protein
MPFTYDFDSYLAQLDRQSATQDYFSIPSSEWTPLFTDENINTNPLAVDNTEYWNTPSAYDSKLSLSPDAVDFKPISPSTTAYSTPSESEATSPKISRKRTSSTKDVKRSKRRESESQPTRKPHKEIEQKYRKSVNAAIHALQHSVPNLSTADDEMDCQPQLTKVAVLVGATKYIKELTQERDRLRLSMKPWDGRG